MYYEEAKVREYKRKDRPYYQVYLGYDSNFIKEEDVVIIRNKDLKELESKANPELIDSYKDKITDLSEEILQLEKDLQEVQQIKEELISEKASIIEEANVEILKASEKIIAESEKHKEELAELNLKLNNEKDLTKALLIAMNDLNKRSFISRLINKEPDSVKKILELKPVEIDVNDISKDK